MERPEIHIINAQGNKGEVFRGIGNPHDGALAMNTLLAEPVIGGQFDFDGNDLAHGGDGKLGIDAAPGNENAAATDVFGVHSAFHPKRRGRDVAPKLDFDSRALASINVLHFFCFDTAEFSSAGEAHQCRKWAITLCCRRIAGKNHVGSRRRERGRPAANRRNSAAIQGLQITPIVDNCGLFTAILATVWRNVLLITDVF